MTQDNPLNHELKTGYLSEMFPINPVADLGATLPNPKDCNAKDPGGLRYFNSLGLGLQQRKTLAGS